MVETVNEIRKAIIVDGKVHMTMILTESYEKDEFCKVYDNLTSQVEKLDKQIDQDITEIIKEIKENKKEQRKAQMVILEAMKEVIDEARDQKFYAP